MSWRLLVVFVVPVVLGVVVGYGLGGTVSAIAGLRVRAVWWLWLAVAGQVAHGLVPVAALGSRSLGGELILAFVVSCVLAWLFANAFRLRGAARLGAWLICAGAVLNAAAMLTNGRMPYALSAAYEAGMRTPLLTGKNEPMSAKTTLPLLGDTIPVHALKVVMSPGDVLVGLGIVVFVSMAMRRGSSSSAGSQMERR